VGASAELGGGERSEVNCRIKGIKELCYQAAYNEMELEIAVITVVTS